MNGEPMPAAIERILRARFAPVHFELHDESARHAGHAGAREGGHYRVVLVAAEFEGLTRVEQHRRVNQVLAGLFGAGVHALALRTAAPSAWPPAASGS